MQQRRQAYSFINPDTLPGESSAASGGAYVLQRNTPSANLPSVPEPPAPSAGTLSVRVLRGGNAGNR